MCAVACRAPCAVLCACRCCARRVVQCRALCAAICASWRGTLCAVPWCCALCAALCCALCAVLCVGSARTLPWCWRCAMCCWCTLVLCPVCYSLCLCTHTCLPHLPCGEGEEDWVAMGALPAAQLKYCQKHLAALEQPWNGCTLWGGVGGGGRLLLLGAVGSLYVHVGTRAPHCDRARALAGPAVAAPPFGRTVRASLAPATLRTLAWPAPTTLRARSPPLAEPPMPAPTSPGPVVVGGGGACPGTVCHSCPARQHVCARYAFLWPLECPLLALPMHEHCASPLRVGQPLAILLAPSLCPSREGFGLNGV